MTVEIRVLERADGDRVFALFRESVARLPRGFLERKSREDMERILSASPRGCVGAFVGGRLAGYALSEVAPWPATAAGNAITRRIRPGEPVADGRGTLAAPAFAGRMMGVRLTRARRDLLASQGVRHVLGAIVTGNIGSVRMFLRCGHALCGFERDSFGLRNFSHYGGPLAAAGPPGDGIETASHDKMARLFAEGYVCRKLRRAPGGAEAPAFVMSKAQGG